MTTFTTINLVPNFDALISIEIDREIVNGDLGRVVGARMNGPTGPHSITGDVDRVAAHWKGYLENALEFLAESDDHETPDRIQVELATGLAGTTFRGFARPEIEAAFNQVANSKDWKAPVSAQIAASAFRLYDTAVQFFTSTGLKVVTNLGNNHVAVEADGYRLGPAN